MAGTFPGGGSKAFRTGIRFVYNMAAPPLTDEQATFYFPSTLVYNSPVDGDNVPFDPNATVTRTVPDPVRVPCGVEFKDASGNVIPFGEMIPAKVAITLLDEDYTKVSGASYVAVRGVKYDYTHTDPPSGLFDVGLYTMNFEAESVT